MAAYYSSNKDKYAIRTRKYKKDHPDKIKEYDKAYITLHKVKHRKYNKVWLRKWREGLPDKYVISLMVDSGINKDVITDEMLELKRQAIIAKRILMEAKKHESND